MFIELNKPYFIFKDTKEKVKEDLKILEPVKKIDIPSVLLIPLKENPVWLPLVNMFSNREIEFEFSLQNIKTVFETFQLQPAYI